MSQTLPQTELVHNKAAEAAVLGSMLLDSRQIPAVLEWLTAESFYFPEHLVIFDAILTVWRRNPGADVDGLLVRSELAGSKELQDAGGSDYLRQVIESVPTSANAAYYAQQVLERQRYRAAVAAVEKMREVLAEGGAADAVVEQIQGLALGLECRPREQHIYAVKDHATAVALQTQEAPCIVRTGFASVDRLACGACPAEIVYVAGRPSAGKTSFACGWALNAARANKHVVFFTLEMSARALMERLSATLGCVSLAAIKRPNPPRDLLNSFYEGSLLLGKLPIVIVENAGTVEQMTATLRQIKQAGPVDLLLLDYIGLVSAGASRNRNRNEQLTEISRDLKRMAQAEHVPVVVLAQLNRECEARENHRPRMSDLRDSGAQEQDADMVLLLHREDYYRKMADPNTSEIDGLAEVIVAKARNGPTGTAQLVFIEEQMRFADVARDDGAVRECNQ